MAHYGYTHCLHSCVHTHTNYAQSVPFAFNSTLACAALQPAAVQREREQGDSLVGSVVSALHQHTGTNLEAGQQEGQGRKSEGAFTEHF